MKAKIAERVSWIAGLLWIMVGLRDTFAPGFFTMSGSVKSKLDIAMEFATGAIFLTVAAIFRRSEQEIDAGKTK